MMRTGERNGDGKYLEKQGKRDEVEKKRKIVKNTTKKNWHICDWIEDIMAI